MGKLVVYECDKCGFITKNKDEVIITQGNILNGEDEILYSSSIPNEMSCLRCFVHRVIPTGMITTDNSLNNLQIENVHQSDQVQINLDPFDDYPYDDSENLEDNDIIIDNPNEQNDISDTTSEPEFNLNEDNDNTDVDNEEEINDDTDITSSEENNTVDDLNTEDIEMVEDEIETTQIENGKSELEKELEQPPKDESVEYDYIRLFKLLSDDDEHLIITKLGYNDINEFYQKTQCSTLKGVCVPLSTGQSYDDFKVLQESEGFAMSIQPVLYNIVEDIPQIQKASVFMSEQNEHIGYITNDILNQLNRKS